MFHQLEPPDTIRRQDTGIASVRLSGFLTHLAKALNVDGYPVLDVDASAQEVRLSQSLLGQQFAIAVT